MDIPQPHKKTLNLRFVGFASVALVLAGYFSWSALSKPASGITLSTSDIVIDQVKRSELVRDVRVPGAAVFEDTLIMALSNPQQTLD